MAEQTSQAATDQKLAIIQKNIDLAQQPFEKLNFSGLSFGKEAEFAMQILGKSTYLQGAHPASIKNSIVNCALTGITLNPVLKFGYLIPRKVGGVLTCVLEPSYMGLCQILTNTGSVVTISATIVYEKEVASLQIQQGAGGYARHTPYIGFEKPGKPVACYSKAILPSGIEHIELLRPWEWESIKLRSESVKSYNDKVSKGQTAYDTTWMTDEEEMIRKTCIKKHYKYLPKTEQAQRMATAIDLDHQANGIDFSKQNQQENQSPYATPNAPSDEVMATGDDLEEMMILFKNPVLGDIVFESVSKDKMIDSVKIKYGKGTLTEEKARAYIDGLKAQIEALNGDVNWKPEDEPESTEEAEPAGPAEVKDEQDKPTASDKEFK